MIKANYFLTGFIGGILGMLPLTTQTNSFVEYFVAFAFAFGLTIIAKDFFNGVRNNIDEKKRERMIFEEL